MYSHSVFPVDHFYSRSELRDQWLAEAADCDRCGRHFQRDVCIKIADSYL